MVKTRVIRLHAFHSFLVEGHDQILNKQLFLEVYYDVFAWNFTKFRNSEALIFFSLYLVYFPKTGQEASENRYHADLSFLCLVLVEPKAPCYRAHVCFRNSGFSRIPSPTTRDHFRAMFV